MLTFVLRQFALLALVLSFALSPALASAQSTPEASPVAASESLQAGVDWLVSQQSPEGWWAGFTPDTADVGATIDAVLALVAAENAGIEVDLTSASAYLEDNISAYVDSGAGQAAKAVLVAIAIGADPEAFGGSDSWESMLDGFSSATDLYGTGVYDTALVMLAYGARNESVPGIVLDKVAELQLADGSWSFDGNILEGSGDSNTTAIMIQALASLDRLDTDQVLHGIEYLHASQMSQGFTFQFGPGALVDANSTGIVIQALIAAGEDPSSLEWQNVAGSMLAFQTESGSFSYQLDPLEDNLFATVQAIPAVAGQAFPLGGETDAAPAELPTCTAEQAVATPVADEELLCAA